MFDELLERLGIEATNSGVCGADWHARSRRVRDRIGEPVDRRSDCARANRRAGRLRPARRGRRCCVRKMAQLYPPRHAAKSSASSARRCASRKRDLGLLVSLEVGKIRSEGEGEVQEMIDICDFAVGLSRQLYGLTIASERPRHRMMEQWHPLGPVGVITAFNFPVAVWAWNATLAAVCGDYGDLEALARGAAHARSPFSTSSNRSWREHGSARGLHACAAARAPTVGEGLLADKRLPLISATGSCAMGRHVARGRRRRLGRTLLELGGNNGMIVHRDARPRPGRCAPSCSPPSARPASAARRIAAADRARVDRRDVRRARSSRRIASVPIGDPWDDGVLMGPLINAGAVERMLERAGGGAARRAATCSAAALRSPGPATSSQPAIVRASPDMPIVARGNLRADPLRDRATGRSTRRSPLHNARRRRACRRRSSRSGCGEAERFLSAARQRLRHRQRQHRHVGCRDRRRVRRRERHRRRPRSRAATPGRPTCAARPARSTTATSCRSPRACASRSRRAAAASWRQRMRTFCLAILLFALGGGLLVGGRARRPAARPTPGRIRQQVLETERAFARSMAERDHAAFASFLSSDAIFFGTEGPLRGSEQIAADWQRYFEADAAPFSWEPEQVEVLDSGELALTSGPVHDPQGALIGTFTSIWRREAPDQWRIVFDKGNAACAPP